MRPTLHRVLSAARSRLRPVREHALQAQLDEVRRAIGDLQARSAPLLPAPASLHDAEFQVFSQWGEDGILAHLVRTVELEDKVFVEIGVHDYRESNTRFLSMTGGWRGVIVNGGTAHQEFLQHSDMGWRYDIEAVSAFVTAANVDEVLTSAGVSGDIALLSIDIDGVDWWVWQSLTVLRPRIVVTEFNSVFGPDAAVTVPYDAAFDATTAHWSGQYFGASLAALHHLATERGYQLVGVNSHGVNAFFVRRDVAGHLWDLTPAEAYVQSRIRTSRGPDGALTFDPDHGNALERMRDLPLHDVVSGQVLPVRDVFGV